MTRAAANDQLFAFTDNTKRYVSRIDRPLGGDVSRT
jgi:hypothetical protein